MKCNTHLKECTANAADVLAAYPDDNNIDNYTDASNFQLRACIVQDRMPVACFSKML
jgi:hypothetical protein